MAARKTKAATTDPKREAPPDSLGGHIFYGLDLNQEQTAYRDAIWDRDIDIVFANARAGSGKTLIAVATAMLMREFCVISGIVYMSAAGVYEHKQGLLPGTLEEKSRIFQLPLRQSLVRLGYDPDRVISSDAYMVSQKDGTACINAQTDSYIRGINIGDDENRVMLIVDGGSELHQGRAAHSAHPRWQRQLRRRHRAGQTVRPQVPAGLGFRTRARAVPVRAVVQNLRAHTELSQPHLTKS